MTKIAGTLVVGMHDSGFTPMVRVQDLHATKGWQPERDVPLRFFGGAPIIGRFHRTRPRRTRYVTEEGRLMRGRSVRPLLPKQLEIAARRHKWYWNEKARKEREHAQM